MKYLGIEFQVKNIPGWIRFIPFGPWMEAYLAGADRPLDIALERKRQDFRPPHPPPEFAGILRPICVLSERDRAPGHGAWRMEDIRPRTADYTKTGARGPVHGPLEVKWMPWRRLLKPTSPHRGGQTRLRRVSAVIDGQTVYSRRWSGT